MASSRKNIHKKNSKKISKKTVKNEGNDEENLQRKQFFLTRMQIYSASTHFQVILIKSNEANPEKHETVAKKAKIYFIFLVLLTNGFICENNEIFIRIFMKLLIYEYFIN